jgi:hypothetical protein
MMGAFSLTAIADPPTFKPSHVAIHRHTSTTTSGFVERFTPLLSGRTATKPQTGTVGTVAAEEVDVLRAIDNGAQRDSRPDADGRWPTVRRRTTDGPVIPVMKPSRASSRHEMTPGAVAWSLDASRTSAAHRASSRRSFEHRA